MVYSMSGSGYTVGSLELKIVVFRATVAPQYKHLVIANLRSSLGYEIVWLCGQLSFLSLISKPILPVENLTVFVQVEASANTLSNRFASFIKQVSTCECLAQGTSEDSVSLSHDSSFPVFYRSDFRGRSTSMIRILGYQHWHDRHKTSSPQTVKQSQIPVSGSISSCGIKCPLGQYQSFKSCSSSLLRKLAFGILSKTGYQDKT